jgi:D-alanyl-D-alanine carboxypeptidase
VPGRARWAIVVTLACIGCGGAEKPVATTAPDRGRPSAGLDAALARELQRALDSGRAALDSPGASAAVVLPDGDVWTGVSGTADLRRHNPVTPDTQFAIGSITKPLVAALALDLAEAGILDLDDRLAKWVPRFPDADRITLRQLLSHTAGTRDFLRLKSFDRAQRRAPLRTAALRTRARSR